jgi:hypothetical protein
VLAVAYVDRQHKYRVFMLTVGNGNRQKKNKVAAQIFSVLVLFSIWNWSFCF